jgi:hypothetical protein
MLSPRRTKCHGISSYSAKVHVVQVDAFAGSYVIGAMDASKELPPAI